MVTVLLSSEIFTHFIAVARPCEQINIKCTCSKHISSQILSDGTHTQRDLLENIIRNDNNKFVTLNLSNETIGLSTAIYLYMYVYGPVLALVAQKYVIFSSYSLAGFSSHFIKCMKMLATPPKQELLYSYLYLFNGRFNFSNSPRLWMNG